jgi:hypothetical protein
MRALTRRVAVAAWMGWLGCGDNLKMGSAPGATIDAGIDATNDAPPGPGIDRVFGGPQDDELLDVAVVGDELVIAGYLDGVLGVSNIDPGGPAVGVIEAFAVDDGAPRWRRTLDTTGADTIESLLVEDISIAFVGRTTGAFPGFTSAGKHDAFVGTTPRTATGSAPVFQFGTERPQHPRAISRDTTGALLLAGFDDVYVEGSVVQDFENAWSARVTIAPSYALDWQRRTTSAMPDRYWAGLAAGPAGEQFVGGGNDSGSGRGPFVARLDATGATLWTRRLSTVGVDAVTAIQRGPDGGLYVAGTTFTQLGSQAYGEQDFFVLALDPDTGATLRAMQAGSTSGDYPRDLAIAADGTVYVVGETIGEVPGATNAGTSDPVVVRFAPDGRWTGAWQRGTAGDDSGAAIALVPGGVVLVGFCAGALVPGVPAAGGRDGFVLRVRDADFVSLP